MQCQSNLDLMIVKFLVVWWRGTWLHYAAQVKMMGTGIFSAAAIVSHQCLRRRSSFMDRQGVCWFVAVALMSILLGFLLSPPAKAEPVSCEAAGVTFTSFEPKEFHWWTGKKQSSSLLVNGKQVATITLGYSDRPQLPDDRKPDKYITVVGERIGLKAVAGTDSLLFMLESGSPSGFIIPVRYDGKTAASRLYTSAKHYASVDVNFEYDRPMQFRELMLHIVCFLKSDFVTGELK